MIFLMSSERSGSNMLRAIMARHSRVSAPTPPHLVKLLMPILAGYGDLQRDSNISRLVSDVLSIIDTQLGEWCARLVAEDIIRELSERSFPAVLRSIYRAEAAAEGKSLSFIKDNGNILWPAQLQANFEDAKFVYLVRDPRDYALSWMKSPTHVGGLGAACRAWRTEQASALNAYCLPAGRQRIILTCYEDLVSSPEAELERICEFVGLDAEPGMLDSGTGRRQREEAKKIKNWENLASDVKRTNFGKFRSQMGRRKVRRIERNLAFEMRVLGYESTGEYGTAIDVADWVGKLYRAAISSVKLLTGGRERRDELATRLRRLRRLQAMRQQVKNSPSPVDSKPTSPGSGA